jgi:hypothetical protein
MMIIVSFPEKPLKLYNAINEEHGYKAGKRGTGEKD